MGHADGSSFLVRPHFKCCDLPDIVLGRDRDQSTF